MPQLQVGSPRSTEYGPQPSDHGYCCLPRTSVLVGLRLDGMTTCVIEAPSASSRCLRQQIQRQIRSEDSVTVAAKENTQAKETLGCVLEPKSSSALAKE